MAQREHIHGLIPQRSLPGGNNRVTGRDFPLRSEPIFRD